MHPTIATYASNERWVTSATYPKLLQASHTVGFSVYLAETQDDPQGWKVLGQAIGELGVAREGGAFAPDSAILGSADAGNRSELSGHGRPSTLSASRLIGSRRNPGRQACVSYR